MTKYILTTKKRSELRDEIEKVLERKKGKAKAWGNINSLVADAYYRGNKKCKKKKPIFIKEPYGLPRELQPTGKFKREKKASPKQIKQRTKFKKAIKVCKGNNDYRGCMKKELKK